MDKLDRIFELHRLLSAARYPMPKSELAEQLDCSEKTVQRVAEAIRDRFSAPILSLPNGYQYKLEPGQAMFELPGLWFNARELTALVGLRSMLQNAEPGLLDDYLSPISERIDALLSNQRIGLPDWERRIRILRMAGRGTGPSFGAVSDALARRCRLRIRYRARSSGEHTERTVSPQRLTHYRDNWYLDAWCHRRDGLRTFAIEQIEHAHRLDEAAIELPEDALQDVLATSYGIFAGQPSGVATLLFTEHAARWVAQEQWHPEQQGETQPDGQYRLRFPFHRGQELVRDICRYGAEVMVESPHSLRSEVAAALRAAADRY